MSTMFEDFLATFKALNEHNIEYILIGGFAMVLAELIRSRKRDQ